MSKNFELLRQAEICLGGVPVQTDQKTAVPSKNEAQATPVTFATAEPVVREEAMKLVQTLFLPHNQAAPKAVLFAAIDPRSQCSNLCAMIATLLAESVSGTVCLVDGNFRNPSLPDVLGISNHHGLADSLRQDGPIRLFTQQTGRENLRLLSAGAQTEEAVNLLNCDQMKNRIAELRKEYDYVLIDAPALNTYADGLVFGRLADGIVLVLEANETRREAAVRIVERVRALQIPLLGAVLNNRTFPIPTALYKRI
jgi:Mrp family chromosome partitioning ATPase